MLRINCSIVACTYTGRDEFWPYYIFVVVIKKSHEWPNSRTVPDVLGHVQETVINEM